IVWMSLADHGVRGAYYSSLPPPTADLPSRASVLSGTSIGSAPVPAAPLNANRMRLTGSGTIALSDTGAGSTAAVLVKHRDHVHAMAAAIVDGSVSGGYVALRIVAAVNEDMWRLAGWLPSDSRLRLPNQLVAISRHDSDRMDDPTDENRVGALLS